MKKQLMLLLQASLVCCLCAGFSHASPAGKIQFADLSAAYGAPSVEINLNRALLSMVSAFSNGQDPELQSMLGKIDEISVRVYNLDKDPDQAFQALQNLNRSLLSQHWQPIVSVNERAEKVSILSKMSNGVMDGLVVMVVDSASQAGSEAVFINIVGEIDPAQLSKVTSALNVNYNVGKSSQ